MTESNNQIEMRKLSWGTGVHKIEAAVCICGTDVVVVLAGGTGYHIGAVALGIPRPSLADSSQVSASASVLCVTGHQEDMLARNAARKIAAAIHCRVTVVAGIHIDKISTEDISQLIVNCKLLIKKIITDLNSLKK
ncbi:hypothetical protein [Sporomusa termitida]|uniref:Prenylated flavin chaperone LpdD-like domain-containing protein n=1 Tax=Sporomusa termitida TaxID=2377 RepID=A0A517DVU3_9FIRM|nr:hypothetical protein [Sporomusa termitida]QDR81443.1 hypothetical protein SPTER_28260 [Sporomusa termitida]